MKIRFIVNPRSGRDRDRGACRAVIARFMAEQDLDGAIVETGHAGHAAELAREAVAQGCTHVVCVGGDGTLNEIARVLVHTPVVLAITPSGSGNGLARHLNLPGALPDALALLRPGAGRVLAIDTGTVNGRLFCNVMGLGLDAEMGARFNRLERRGFARYLLAAARFLRERRTETCRIECGADSWTQETLLVAVANSDQYGKNARIAAGASVQDGILDLVAIEPLGTLKGLLLAARLFRGGLRTQKHVRRAQGPEITITRSAPGIIHTDGEIWTEPALLRIAVQPNSLRIIVRS